VATVAIASSTVSANTPLAGNGESILITNPNSSVAYVRFSSDPAVLAAISDTPILPNSKMLLRCGPLVLYCAVVLASGSGSVMFTRGDGSVT
jgi:hypothetical protein